MKNQVAIHAAKNSDQVSEFMSIYQFSPAIREKHEDGSIHGFFFDENGNISAVDDSGNELIDILDSKDNYEVVDFDDYFGIAAKGSHGGNLIWGGDSAWEDCYDKDLVNEIFEKWDGVLNEEGNLEVK